MKKLFTLFNLALIVLLMGSHKSYGQQEFACKMNLNPYIGTFEYLTSGTRISDIEVSSCASKTSVPIGFTFRFGPCGAQVGYTTVQVSSAGWLKFGAAASGCSVGSSSTTTVFPAVWAMWANNATGIDGTSGTATYETQTLASGNRVFVMEWKNWRYAADLGGYFGISFQIRLYEGSNVIEYAYKQETSTAGTGAVISAPYMTGMMSSKYTVTKPCYDWITMQNPITTPVVNRTGAYGPAQAVRPNDNQILQFYQACCGKPAAGTISQPDSVCACQPFVAKLSGATPNPFTNFGVRYQWQTAASATGPWSDIPGGIGTSQYFSGICASTDTFIRVIVSCDSSNLSDTTPVKRIGLITKPYNCYCYSSATIDDNLNTVNIGNVTLTNKGGTDLINSGTGTPGFLNKQFFRPYTLKTSIRPIAALNRDSSYKYKVMGITKDTFAFAGSGVATYIDWDKDGSYNASTELANFNMISGTSAEFTSTISVPSWATKDTLGMRVVMKKGAASATDVPPCGGYSEGETEDYLVVIQDPICPGPLNAGRAFISDTSMCDGYITTVWDTGHARGMSQMNWLWEYSLDNVIWATVPGTQSKDTITPVVRQNTYYRLRMICEATKDTIYSNKVYIKRKEPYKCYCYGIANGTGGADSSDISAFKIGSYIFNSGGPHLRNPESIRLRTDYTDRTPMELSADTKYEIAVYHTLNTKNHGDARISVFIDYNHNLAYDIPSELVWTKTSTYGDFYPHDTIKIPAAVIPNVITGMRVVLNNDMNGNLASDFGCGTFTSGEIEDYLVIFRRGTTNIGELSNVDNLQIFPNPNSGEFTVSFSAAATISEASIAVTSITGQQVMFEQYKDLSNTFSRNYNLSGKVAAGVYFVTVVADGQKTVQKLIIK